MQEDAPADIFKCFNEDCVLLTAEVRKARALWKEAEKRQ